MSTIVRNSYCKGWVTEVLLDMELRYRPVVSGGQNKHCSSAAIRANPPKKVRMESSHRGWLQVARINQANTR